MVLKNSHRTENHLSLVHNLGGIPSMYQVADFPEVVPHFQCTSGRHHGQEQYHMKDFATQLPQLKRDTHVW